MQELFKCFVAMKFGEPFDSLYNKGILPLANVDFNDARVSFMRADRNLKSLDFLRNVWMNIKASNFVLADISPFDNTPFNPNVFYEIGYAKALNMPVIVISHGGHDRPPVNVTDCIKLVYPYYKEDMEAMADQLSNILTPAIGEAINTVKRETMVQSESYDVTCYKDRNAADIGKAIVSARREIIILQTNLATIHLYLESILEAIKLSREQKTQLRVRILTLDPDSYFAAFRAKQLTIAVAEYRKELHENIVAVIKELRTYPEVQLRVYDDFPTQIVFMADDKVFDCTVARRFRSRNLCTFKIDLRSMGVEKSFLFHFESLWEIAGTYKAEFQNMKT